MGVDAERYIKNAREIIAGTIGADSKEVYFTSGGTESNNLAIRGYLGANPRKGNHIITTGIEHPSVLEVYKHLSQKGYEVDYIDVDKNGIIDLKQLGELIRDNTALISLVLVNNEIGSVQPIDEIIGIKNTRNRKTAIHIDAVQAYGKIRMPAKKAGIDMMSISSHKIHGPKGVGALFVSKPNKIRPIIFGGGQESLLRSGTENVSGIAGFGLAAEMIYKEIDDNFLRVSNLKERFVKGLNASIEAAAVISDENCSPYIINVSFANLKSEVLLHHLAERNIYVSTGSACSSRKNVHSHVLKAIGLSGKEIEGSVRFSLGSFNTEQDIDNTLLALKEIVPKIQFKTGGRK